MCSNCENTVKTAVLGLAGVNSVYVDLTSKDVKVSFDAHQVTIDAIAAAIDATGFEVTEINKAEHTHGEDYRNGGYDRAAAHFEYLLETEFYSHCEHKEYNANAGPCFYAPRIAYGGRIRHVWTGKEARHYVAEHQGLLEAFEYESNRAGQYENQRQVVYQFGKMFHVFVR